MRRAIHTLGRWRRTHCQTCGRRATGQPAVPAGRRLAHLHPEHCAHGAAR